MKTSIISLSDSLHLKGCVLGYGHFNTIHPGHIRYLRNAREQGDSLVIALMGDAPSDQLPIFQFTQAERAEAVALLGIAEAIVLLDKKELLDVVKVLEPSTLVLGKEFQSSEDEDINKAISAQRDQGNLIKFHAGEINYASTDLLKRSEKELSEQRRQQFMAACQRQGLCKEKLLGSMDSWNTTKLVVVGDTIVDQYAACEAIGMSAEAPVVVVRELEKRNFIGGAAVVASHIKALGASCDLLSVVGADRTSDLVRESLIEQGIGDELIEDPSRPTTFKKRYMVENQKLFRVSRVEDHSLEPDLENKAIDRLKAIAPHVDGIVVSDFVYGVVTNKLLETIQEMAKEYGLLLFGDLQCSSQVGAVTRFKNFSLLCPNEREARIALQDNDIGLELLSRRLLESTNTDRLIMKLGPEGFITYDRKYNGELVSQAFPALSVNPVDVAGAGDSLLAVMATGLASGESMMTTAALGCCMTALAVETMGNKSITNESLRSSLIEVLGA